MTVAVKCRFDRGGWRALLCLALAWWGLASVGGAIASEPFAQRLATPTVRWLDVAQEQTFTVEGERYRCRVDLQTARIAAIEIDGVNLLSAEGLSPEFTTADGRRYLPAPVGIRPDWQVWRGQKWVPATSSRARLNVWSSGPHYWDAHVLDIPFVPADALAELTASDTRPPVAQWDFETTGEGWEALQHCPGFQVTDGRLVVDYAGDDPYFHSPPLALTGPLELRLRLRATVGGQLAVYWATAGSAYRGEQHALVPIKATTDWQELRLPLPVDGPVTRLRLDPPGTLGRLELDSVALVPLDRPSRQVRPIRGEVVFHAFADRLNIEFRLEPGADEPVPVEARWATPGTAAALAEVARRPVLQVGPAAVLGVVGARFEAGGQIWRAPLTGDRPGSWWVVRPAPPATAPAEIFGAELEPLAADQVVVREGQWRGYDAPSGLYLLDALASPGAYSFNAAFDNPNRRLAVPVTIRGDKRARRLVIKCASGTGILPATILADPAGFMLPTPVQSSKNFAGEREEPDDTAYGDAYFPLDLAPGEQRSFQIVHLFQRWGDHPLKQVSSIRFFHIYWHLSCGVSETTCFTLPWMLLNDQFVRIPDYRPLSGPFWPGQPQHDCLSWPGLLQYRSNGQRVRLMYDRTEFASIAPNLATFTMRFHTSDDTARASLTALEIPQTEEMRTFLRVRYDWDRAATIDGDARVNFRWLNVNDKKLPRLVLWSNNEGRTQTRQVTPEAGAVLLGQPLPGDFPFLGSHGMPGSQGAREYHSLVLLRAFRARLGGRAITVPTASAEYGPRGGNYWLGAETEALSLQPGDFLEAELMLMPHAEAVEPDLKPERERLRFGAAGPAVGNVTIGRKLADFPATVAAEDEAARFELIGGHDALPVVVTGFRGWGVPLLWQQGVWQNQQAHGGDGYQVDPDGEGGYRFTFVIPLRHGMKPQLTVTRAACSAAIVALRDRNGFPELEAAEPGRFQLRAPVLFAPGLNEIEGGADGLVNFTGSGQRVRAIPLVARAPGPARVALTDWSEAGLSAVISGPVTLELTQLRRDSQYLVTLDGQAETRTTGKAARLVIDLAAGEHTLVVRRD